jgi:Spx/MgsR family transcriptional regulator
MIDFYGIPGCDTVKKARAWLDAHGIAYVFHDYKKEGADPKRLERWVAAKGWETLLNRRGTTFRQLSEADKTDIDAAKAVRLMLAQPSLIKRPVVEYPGGLLVGFDPEAWARALS